MRRSARRRDLESPRVERQILTKLAIPSTAMNGMTTMTQ